MRRKKKVEEVKVEPVVEAPVPPPTDEELQEALDPEHAGNGLGIRIMRRIELPGGAIGYFVDGGYRYIARSRWVEVRLSDTLAERVAKVHEVLAA